MTPLVPANELCEANDSYVVALLHLGAIAGGKLANSVDYRGADVRVGQHWATALAPAPAEALFDWMDRDLFKAPFIEVHGRYNVLPKPGMSDVAFLTVGGSNIEKVCRSRIRTKVKSRVSVCRKRWHSLVLENEIA